MIATDKLLMRLSNLDALPGQESQVQEVLMTIIDSNGVKDSFGNLYFGDLTTKRKIALYAHMDEVGFCPPYHRGRLCLLLSDWWMVGACHFGAASASNLS